MKVFIGQNPASSPYRVLRDEQPITPRALPSGAQGTSQAAGRRHKKTELLLSPDSPNGLQMAESPESKKELQLERISQDAEVLLHPEAKNHRILGVIIELVRSELC